MPENESENQNDYLSKSIPSKSKNKCFYKVSKLLQLK